MESEKKKLTDIGFFGFGFHRIVGSNIGLDVVGFSSDIGLIDVSINF